MTVAKDPGWVVVTVWIEVVVAVTVLALHKAELVVDVDHSCQSSDVVLSQRPLLSLQKPVVTSAAKISSCGSMVSFAQGIT